MLVGRYRVIRRLSHSQLATVWLAEDTRLNRLVVVKVLPRGWANDPLRRERLEYEARLIALLEHPCIVPLYDFGYNEDGLYLVMRYMTGGTLANWAGGRPHALHEVLPHLIRIAQALDALHDRGWVHRAVLASARPFTASTLADLLTQHQEERTLLLPARELELPPGTDLIVAKAMAQSPFDRFVSAGDFVHALSITARAKPFVARSKPAWQARLGHLFHRHPRQSFDAIPSWRHANRLDPRRKVWRRAAVAFLLALCCVLAISLTKWSWMVDIAGSLHLQASTIAGLIRVLSPGLPVGPLPIGP